MEQAFADKQKRSCCRSVHDSRSTQPRPVVEAGGDGASALSTQPVAPVAGGEPIVYKMHGSVQPDEKLDNFVITKRLRGVPITDDHPGEADAGAEGRPSSSSATAWSTGTCACCSESGQRRRPAPCLNEESEPDDGQDQESGAARVEESPSWAIQYRPSRWRRSCGAGATSTSTTDIDLFVDHLRKFL